MTLRRAGRFYLTLDHVQNVLETVESLGSYARNLNAVKLAAWLHDVIYDSKASDNKEPQCRLRRAVVREAVHPGGPSGCCLDSENEDA